jgi:transposase
VKYAPNMVDVSIEELKALIERLEKQEPKEGDCRDAARLLSTLMYIKQVFDEKSMSIKRLLNLLFGSVSSEKTKKLLKTAGRSEAQSSGENDAEKNKGKKKKPKGHGRNGADAYTGAERFSVPLGKISPGCACPFCQKGKVYLSSEGPKTLVRLRGEAPVQAKVWELERLRCNLCGEVITAEAPPEAGQEKYDASAGAIIALLKYGSGFPFHRLQQLQENFGIPLPASTQWDIVAEIALRLQPVFEELRRQAANGKLFHNDDTSVRILELMKENAQRETQGDLDELVDEYDTNNKKKQRTGMFTTAVVSVVKGKKIAIFNTGREHAGESLAGVLRQRTEAEIPLQMSDALSRNIPKDFKTILANCLTHGRRYFTKLVDAFPDECLFVIETLRDVYTHDATTIEQKMSPEDRLDYHKEHSAPLMEKLHDWLEAQFSEKRVEPNSSLGQAIKYMKKHWKKLTLFLLVPGAPLDNNICERALKMCILHRKNALFFKTLNGAAVGDLFMSLIQTCRLCRVNALNYLTELLRHAHQATADPKSWMPWNYRDQLTPKDCDSPQET